jgi:hypothetical protein
MDWSHIQQAVIQMVQQQWPGFLVGLLSGGAAAMAAPDDLGQKAADFIVNHTPKPILKAFGPWIEAFADALDRRLKQDIDAANKPGDPPAPQK